MPFLNWLLIILVAVGLLAYFMRRPGRVRAVGDIPRREGPAPDAGNGNLDARFQRDAARRERDTEFGAELGAADAVVQPSDTLNELDAETETPDLFPDRTGDETALNLGARRSPPETKPAEPRAHEHRQNGTPDRG